MNNTFLCPICSGEVKRNAKACPHCGSDSETGWSDETVYDDIGLPDFEDVENEFEKPKSSSPIWVQVVGTIIAIGFLVMLLLRV